jgi:hypothetical protein
MMLVTTRIMATAALSASLLGLGLAVPLAQPASGAAQRSGTTIIWMVKGQDLEPWCNGSNPNDAKCTPGNPGVQSIGLLKDAAEHKVTLPSVTYRLCGQWHGTVYGKSDYTTCQRGDTLVVEDYTKLKKAIADGVFTVGGLRTAVYDIETWDYTPSGQSHNPVAAIKQALKIARGHVGLIVTPGGGVVTLPGGKKVSLARCSACWEAAARGEEQVQPLGRRAGMPGKGGAVLAAGEAHDLVGSLTAATPGGSAPRACPGRRQAGDRGCWILVPVAVRLLRAVGRQRICPWLPAGWGLSAHQ